MSEKGRLPTVYNVVFYLEKANFVSVHKVEGIEVIIP